MSDGSIKPTQEAKKKFINFEGIMIKFPILTAITLVGVIIGSTITLYGSYDAIMDEITSLNTEFNKTQVANEKLIVKMQEAVDKLEEKTQTDYASLNDRVLVLETRNQ